MEREEDAVNWDLFSESERSRFYAKYNMAALLRGDAKTQAEILEIERRNAIINADEWRELTDRNPLPDGQGKMYFMPLNMAPVDHMLERDPESLPAPQRSIRSADRKAKEERGLAIRDKLREAHRPAFEDGARRFVRPEVQALRRAIKRALQDGDPARSINDWIEEYYPDHRQRIYRVMRPLVYALAAMIAEAAFDEVGADPLDVTEWVEAYTDNLARREVALSISEIRKVMGETKLEELGEVLTAKSEQWEENRPGRVANRELVRVASGAARWAWQTAGIAALVWKANADACPICKELDGKRIPTRSYFLTEGDAVGSGTNTLVVGEPIGGPPLHEGCICDIVPG